MNNTPNIIDDSPPCFNTVVPQHIVNEIEALLYENKRKIQHLIQNHNKKLNETIISEIEALNVPLSSLMNILIHLRDVMSSEEVDKFLNDAIIKISNYNAELMNNKYLYEIYYRFSQNIEIIKDSELQKILIKSMLNFKFSGIELDTTQKNELNHIMTRLTELGHLFEENIIKSLDRYQFHVTDIDILQGVSDDIKNEMRIIAQQRGLPGFVIQLNNHHYSAIMKSADSSFFRQQIYNANLAIASEKDENKDYDNTHIMTEILLLREKTAKLLDFKNYAEYTLFDRSFNTTKEIYNFLWYLASAFRNMAKKEIIELEEFNKLYFNQDQLYPWDVEYLSQKLLSEKYKLPKEILQLSIPEKKAINALFNLAKMLFNIEIKETYCKDGWHEDVRLFNIYDKEKTLIGKFYLDIYHRTNKRQGAWCSELKSRFLMNGILQIPIVCIAANIHKKKDNQQYSLSHQDLIVLFHEFGHCLQKLLTRINQPMIGGDTGIKLDATEIASQFMENWAWNEDVLKNLLNGEFPDYQIKEFLEKLKFMKNFQIGIRMMQNTKLSLLDIMLHTKSSTDYMSNGKLDMEKLSREITNIIDIFPFEYSSRTVHTFCHIFSRCFAAGYYGYLFSEMIAVDAYSAFIGDNINLAHVGEHFKTTFLENGALQDPTLLFTQFRGRPFSIHAFFRYYGIDEENMPKTSNLNNLI